MPDEIDPEEMEDAGAMEPSVPTDLLELHLELEEAGVSPQDFKEAYA